MTEQRPIYGDKQMLTKAQEKEWKLKLANAILEETEIEVGDEIEHQCGTVWVGKFAISAIETEDDETEQGNTKTPL